MRRFLFASRSPLSLAALFERDPSALETLLKVFALGQQWRELVIADPEAFDLLRMTDGQPLSRKALLGEVCAEVLSLDERAVGEALGRIRRRQTLRIAYGEAHSRHKYELVAEQLTYLAEALIAAAWRAASRRIQEQRPMQRRVPNREPRACIIALGRLGAAEMDYGNDLELLLLYNARPRAKRPAGLHKSNSTAPLGC